MTLPGVLAELVDRWGLVLDEPFGVAQATLVVPVSDRQGRSLVLKVHPDPEWARYEHAAIAHWDGHGCVRPIAFDARLGAILEERVTPGDRLRDSSMGDADATDVFVQVAARLRTAGSSAPRLPHLSTWLTRLERCEPVAELPDLGHHLAGARRSADELFAATSDVTVLHGDLHHSNLLRRGASWIAVDPKGIVGPPEAEPAAFLRNPRSRLLALPDPVAVLTARCVRISEGLGYDAARVARWGYVLCVLSAAWAQEDGELVDQMRRWLLVASMMEEVCHAVG